MAFFDTRRQIKLDLVTYLREEYLLKQGIYKNYADVPLSLVKLQDGRNVYKNTNYFNWVYYLPTGVSATYPPIIKDGITTISSANYYVNYKMGEVEFTGYTVLGTITASFSTLLYTVSEDMDSLFDLLDSPLSYIAIQDLSIREEGLQLGGGVKQNCEFTLEITSYARTASIARARNDTVLELVKRGLKSIPLVDYTQNFPLDFRGNRIGAYNRATQSIVSPYTTVSIYPLLENSVSDFDIPNFTDSREYARSLLRFTLIATADTADIVP